MSDLLEAWPSPATQCLSGRQPLNSGASMPAKRTRLPSAQRSVSPSVIEETAHVKAEVLTRLGGCPGERMPKSVVCNNSARSMLII